MPSLVLLQSDLVSQTDAVIVAPLAQSILRQGSRLYLEFAVAGKRYTPNSGYGIDTACSINSAHHNSFLRLELYNRSHRHALHRRLK